MDLAVFFRQLAAMIKSGISMVQAIDLLSQQGESKRLRVVAHEILPILQDGGSLSGALARYPWMFSKLQISIIRAGELSGDMQGSTDRIAHYLEWENSLRQTVKVATIYPKILVVGVIFLPKLYVVMTNDAATYLHETLSVFLPVVGSMLLIWAAYRVMNQISFVRYAFDMLKLIPPKIGRMIKMLALAKFYRSFSAMYMSGVPISQGIQYAAEACGNEYLSKNLLKAVPKLERGVSISDSLIQTKVLPSLASDLLQTGRVTGNVDEMMNKLAEYTENDAEVAVKQAAIILGFLLLLCIGVYVGYVVIQFHMGRADSISSYGM